MAAPSPLHRDPDSGDINYGCYSPEANWRVAVIVNAAIDLIETGQLTTDDEIVDHIRPALRAVGDGACDTIVKENVFYALDVAIREAGIAFDHMKIYGW